MYPVADVQLIFNNAITTDTDEQSDNTGIDGGGTGSAIYPGCGGRDHRKDAGKYIVGPIIYR